MHLYFCCIDVTLSVQQDAIFPNFFFFFLHVPLFILRLEETAGKLNIQQ